MFKVRFSDLFRGYRKATPGCNKLKCSVKARDVVIFRIRSKSAKKLKTIWLFLTINVEDFSIYYSKYLALLASVINLALIPPIKSFQYPSLLTYLEPMR